MSILNAQRVIGDIFDVLLNTVVEESKESTASLTQKKQKQKADQAKQMQLKVKEDREQKLIAKMSNLRVGQEDMQAMGDIQIQIEERLI